MKTGILLLARMGSKRLPGKHLLEVCGKPIVQYLIDRIRLQFQAELDAQEVQLLLATSDEDRNQVFEGLAGITVFYGDIHNIPLRVYQATQRYGLRQFILVDGDDILCSVQGMRAVYQALCGGQNYACTKDLPFGMNSQGFQTTFYIQTVSPYFETKVLETGWGRVFPENTCYIIAYPQNEQYDLLRFTLDYAEDFDLFKTIIEHFADRILTIAELEVISFVLNMELYKLTDSIRKRYWERFHEQVEKENDGSCAVLKS